MRLVIDYQKCRKSGQCSYLHAELITADPDGTPRVIVDTISDNLCEAAEDVVDICPSGAIALVEEGANEKRHTNANAVSSFATRR